MSPSSLKEIIGQPTSKSVVTVERGQLATFAGAVKDASPMISRDPRAAAGAGLARNPRASHLSVRDGELRGVPRAAARPTGPSANAMASVLGPLMAKGGIILHGEQGISLLPADLRR